MIESPCTITLFHLSSRAKETKRRAALDLIIILITYIEASINSLIKLMIKILIILKMYRGAQRLCTTSTFLEFAMYHVINYGKFVSPPRKEQSYSTNPALNAQFSISKFMFN